MKVKTYPDPNKKRKPIIEWKTIQKPLSKTSIRIILNELCALLSHAVEENIMPSNPALKLGKYYKQAKDTREEIQPLNAEEVGVFLDSVLQHSKEFYPLFLTALHTGMRKSELAGLEWGDVNFHGKFFLLRRQLTRGRIEPSIGFQEQIGQAVNRLPGATRSPLRSRRRIWPWHLVAPCT
jgi:integrase